MCNTRKEFLILVVFLCSVSIVCAQFNYLSCGLPKIKIAPLIHKGSDAMAGHWPWHAALFRREEYQCGGSIIDANTILTASHCVYNTGGVVPTKEITVHVGQVNLNKTNEHTQKHDIKEIIVHPGASQTSINHDIALIKLSSNITMNNYVQAVCLWTMDSKQDLIVGKKGTIVGFGINERDELPNQLKQALIQVIDPLTCIEMDRSVFGIQLTSDAFCGIGQMGVSACNGDSGGGLFFEVRGKWFLRGLVSYTSVRRIESVDLCDPLKPTVYTDVAKYLEWIKPYVDQRILPHESDFFDIDYEEKLRLFNFETCGKKSSIQLEDGVNWTLPWVGTLMDHKGSYYTPCLVTLISEWYAVTTAECVVTVKDNNLVFFGGYNEWLNETCHVREGVTECHPTQILQIKNVTKHPEFNRNTQAHDIALIEFLTPANTTQPNVKPICIPITPQLRTNTTTNLHMMLLVKVGGFKNIPVRYVEYFECIKKFSQESFTLKLYNNQQCVEKVDNVYEKVNNGEEITCTAMPGAPIKEMYLNNGTERYFLRGLLLFASVCTINLPTIYLNIEPYLDWILYNMRHHTVEKIDLESECSMLQQQPGKEKNCLFNTDTCGVTFRPLQPEDHVPWVGSIVDGNNFSRHTVVLISEWYALAPKRIVQKKNVWLYIELGGTEHWDENNKQYVEILNIIIPSPDHPSQSFALIELIKPADLNNPTISTVCLPFIEPIHQLDSSELVMSRNDFFKHDNIYCTKTNAIALLQALLLGGYSLAEENSFCLNNSTIQIQELGSPFQMRVLFRDHLQYYLYGMKVTEVKAIESPVTKVNLFKKIESEDLEWIVTNTKKKTKQTSFPTSKNERVNLGPVQLSSSKWNLFDFHTCGVSSSSNPTPWTGIFLCRSEYNDKTYVNYTYTVTLMNEWYAIGPAKVHDYCFNNGVGSNNIAIFGYPCYKRDETKNEDAKIIETCKSPSQRIAIKEIQVHPQYNGTSLVNNIALIRFATPVNTSLPNVKPICLPIIDEIRSYNTSSLAMTVSHGNTVTYENEKIHVRYVNMTECQKRWKNRKANLIINRSNLCMINQRNSDETCVELPNGASLYSRQMLGSTERDFLRGFAFEETSRCNVYLPALYTNTDAHLNWILETMEPPASPTFDLGKELIFSN